VAWNNKAGALVNLGRYDEGLQAAEKAIDLDQGSATTWYIKNMALRALGHNNEADAALDKAVKLGYTGNF
jgi:tetratricopeptide (TPR) repeat protein